MEKQGYTLRALSSSMAMLTRINANSLSGFAVLPLAKKLEHQSVEEISSAIEAACELADSGSKFSNVRIKFHPGTKLLFVAGTPRQIAIARDIMAKLPNDSSLSPPAAPNTKK